jgi:hypothetical protein
MCTPLVCISDFCPRPWSSSAPTSLLRHEQLLATSLYIRMRVTGASRYRLEFANSLKTRYQIEKNEGHGQHTPKILMVIQKWQNPINILNIYIQIHETPHKQVWTLLKKGAAAFGRRPVSYTFISDIFCSNCICLWTFIFEACFPWPSVVYLIPYFQRIGEFQSVAVWALYKRMPCICTGCSFAGGIAGAK